MLDCDALFSYLLISLKDNDLSFFRRYFYSFNKEDRMQAANQIHGSPELIGSFVVGYTPLMYAVHYNRNAFVEFLLRECGAFPDVVSRLGPDRMPVSAANLAIAKGYFKAFNCIVRYANFESIVTQQRHVGMASIHCLAQFFQSAGKGVVLDQSAITAIGLILKHSNQGDVEVFMARLQTLDGLGKENMFVISEIKRAISKTIGVLPELRAMASPSRSGVLMLPAPGLTMFGRDGGHKVLLMTGATGQKGHESNDQRGVLLDRVNSFDISTLKKPLNKKPSSFAFRRTSKVLPGVSKTTFMRIFQAKFMRKFLDALLSQDISNFNGCGETMYGSIKENIDNLTGMSSAIADNVMSMVSASKQASISSTVRKAAKLLIMSEGPSGLHENEIDDSSDLGQKKTNEDEDGDEENPGLDDLKISRRKQARMNHISARLALQILSAQPMLTTLRYEVMLYRIDAIIKKVFDYIDSDCFNPMAAGFSNEIEFLVNQLYQGYLAPSIDTNRVVAEIQLRGERKKQSRYGYFYQDQECQCVRYFIQKKELSKKNPRVDHFFPLPEVHDIKHYPEVSRARVIGIMRKNTVSLVLSEIKKHWPFSQHGFKSGNKKYLRVVLLTILQEEFTDHLFSPERCVQQRELLLRCLSQQVLRYTHRVKKPRSPYCFLGKMKSKTVVAFSSIRPTTTDENQSANFKVPVLINTALVSQLKPFLISALRKTVPVSPSSTFSHYPRFLFGRWGQLVGNNLGASLVENSGRKSPGALLMVR